MYGKFKTRLDAFWHNYIPPIFFLKSFSWYQKFPIHEFFRSDVLWKLFDIGFPYKHCYFKPVCLLVKMASETVIRPVGSRITANTGWKQNADQTNPCQTTRFFPGNSRTDICQNADQTNSGQSKTIFFFSVTCKDWYLSRVRRLIFWN